MKPGSVSSAERRPPPIVSEASRIFTPNPARASVIAAARPLGPAPTTIAWRREFAVMALLEQRIRGVSKALQRQNDTAAGGVTRDSSGYEMRRVHRNRRRREIFARAR